MAKLKKPRMKVWALNMGNGLYDLTLSTDTSVTVESGPACYFDAESIAICGRVFEKFTSIRLESGQVGRVNLASLKQVRLVEVKRGKKKR